MFCWNPPYPISCHHFLGYILLAFWREPSLGECITQLLGKFLTYSSFLAYPSHFLAQNLGLNQSLPISSLFLSFRSTSFMPKPKSNLHVLILPSVLYPFETFGRFPEIPKAIQLKSLPYSFPVAQVNVFGVKPESSSPLLSYIQTISKPCRLYFQNIFRTQ